VDAGDRSPVRALLSDGDSAERWYRESIERVGRTALRAQLAALTCSRGSGCAASAVAPRREQLRTAHDMLDAMGMDALAERARREVQAIGETARKRTVEISVELTAQEAQVARLARDGLSNPRIGARLFISTRTAAAVLRR
jgi:DNA-binding NarL/FixJ family response regulator